MQNKVVIPWNSVLRGMAYFVPRKGRKRKEIARKSRSLRVFTLFRYLSIFQYTGKNYQLARLVGGVTGRPETMCPRSNVLGPLVP